MEIFLPFLIVIIFVIALVISLVCSANSNDTKSQLRTENTRAITNWKQKRKEAFDTWIKSMRSKYGEIEIIIPIVPSEPQKTILIFKEKQEIYFSASWLKFKDISASQIIDNPRIKAGTTVEITEGDLWREIKRSSMQRSFGKTAGTLLAGPEKYTTEYQKTPDKIYHNYSVLISTLNISHPLFEINVGENEMVAHQINAIINTIITHQHNE